MNLFILDSHEKHIGEDFTIYIFNIALEIMEVILVPIKREKFLPLCQNSIRKEIVYNSNLLLT